MKNRTKKNIKPNLDTSVTAFNKIGNLILDIRGQKVMLDSDLAALYGVQTKRLNEQVKRNVERFPGDFMFKLSSKELSEVVANCDHLKKLKFSYQEPYVFTEHGALMLASVLNSDLAIKVSVEIVRAFIHMRTILFAHKDLAKKIDALERKTVKHDENFKIIFDALRNLMSLSQSKVTKVGFIVDD